MIWGQLVAEICDQEVVGNIPLTDGTDVGQTS